MNINAMDFLDLSYFAEWGGKSWEKLLAYACGEFLDGNLEGKHVLDIGTRYGRMACFFAMLGGTVTGVDIHKDYLSSAEAEAKKWGVQEKTKFICYDRDLDLFPDNTFDLIFTKSVLVLIPDLEEFLLKVSNKLKPGGKVVFLENAKGGFITHALRLIRHRGWDCNKINYFTEKELEMIEKLFHIDIIKKSLLPPIYLICGHSRDTCLNSNY